MEAATEQGVKTEPTVSAAEVEAAVAAAAAATNLPTAEVIGKQPMTQINMGMYWCNVCTTGMNAEDALEMHLKGKKHRSKLARVDATMFLPHVPLGPLSRGPSAKLKRKPGASGEPAGTTFKCEVCECEFPSQIPYDAHMAGKKHAKKMAAPQIEAEKFSSLRFSCALCKFVGNSPTHLEAHLKGKQHAKKAGLPAPPPGPAVTVASANRGDKKPKSTHRYQPYFKPKDSYRQASTSGGFYQTNHIPQVKTDYDYSHGMSPVKTVSEITDSNGANPAAYTTGISGNYGFSLYEK